MGWEGGVATGGGEGGGQERERKTASRNRHPKRERRGRRLQVNHRRSFVFKVPSCTGFYRVGLAFPSALRVGRGFTILY